MMTHLRPLGQAPISTKIDSLSCLTPGDSYYVQLDGFNGATSTGKIKVSDCVCDPLSIELEGDCQNRIIDAQAGVDTGINS